MKNWLAVMTSCLLLSACNHEGENSETTSPIKPVASPASSASGEPYLFTDSDGLVYLSWVQTRGDSSYLNYATLEGEQWSAPTTIISGNDWFVNWADFPSLSTNNSQQMLAHFLQKSGEGSYAYDVKLVSSHNGYEWSEPRALNNDGKEAEHGFVTILPYKDNFFVSWLDGRNTASDNQETSSHNEHGSGAMSIRGAIIDSSGATINEWVLDNRTCDCCQTTAAITSNGPVVIYRDRSEDEIRDMSVVRWENDSWTAPQPLYNDHWKIAGCPVNGPKADAIDNALAVAWFSAPEGKAQVKVIFSEDGGTTFGTPVLIDSAKTVGRVDLTLLNKDTAMVSWMAGADIKAVMVSRNGEKGQPVLVGSSSEARASGFPQMTKAGDRLVFAWTDSQEKKVKTAMLNLK